jgi:nitrogenase molybdenum-iron protein alpha/beta subunit
MSMVDHTPRYIISSSVGVAMVVNAIRDAYLLVDGPDCVYMRNQYLQGNHDLHSTLTDVSGRHKVSHTGLEPAGVALSREDELIARLREIASDQDVACALITPMPLADVLGIDYERLCREAASQTQSEVLYVPGTSLTDDWLGGYGEALRALARGLDGLEEASHTDRRPGTVAVVGLLFDRNEEDCKGNVRELARLLEAMGLELVSVWLDGGDVSQLRKVATAESIISLPYGRKAARVLAKRLGAALIETDLPFGLGATERWLEELGRHLGREDEARSTIERKLATAVPKLEWLVHSLFEGRRFGYLGDPHLFVGCAETIKLVGGELAFAVITNVGHHIEEPAQRALDELDACLIEPRTETLMSFISEQLEANDVDCVVTHSACSDLAPLGKVAVAEFGFPSYNVHALIDRPNLGFRGALSFFEILANTMRTFLSRADMVGIKEEA